MGFSFQHGHSEEPPGPTRAIHIPQLSAEAQHLRPHFQPGAKFKGRPEWTAEGRQSPERGLAHGGLSAGNGNCNHRGGSVATFCVCKDGFIVIFAYVHTIMVLPYPPIASLCASNLYTNPLLTPTRKKSFWSLSSMRCAWS